MLKSDHTHKIKLERCTLLAWRVIRDCNRTMEEAVHFAIILRPTLCKQVNMPVDKSKHEPRTIAKKIHLNNHIYMSVYTNEMSLQKYK